jgi:cell division protein FtsB
MADQPSSTISRAPRSSTVAKPARPRRASDAGRSRVGDLTRPIAIDRRILRRRRSTVLLGIVALAIAGSLAAALFVLPVQTYFDQDATIVRREAQLRELDAVNADLAAEVDRLRTDDGIREAAREELGYVEAGEARLSLVAPDVLPTALPAGWPYSVVTSIIALRSATTSAP